MTFHWRRFLVVLAATGLAALLTFLLIQVIQGQFDDITRTLTRAGIMGLGLGLLFSIERRKTGYPWME